MLQTFSSDAPGQGRTQASSITEILVTGERGAFSYLELATGRTLTASEFVCGINSRAARRNAAPWVFVLGLLASVMLAGVPEIALGLFAATTIFAVFLNRDCQRHRQTAADYRLDAAQQSAFVVLQDGVKALSRSSAIWRVPPNSSSFVSARVGAHAGLPEAPWIRSAIAIPGIAAGSESIHFFPDQLLIRTRGMYAPISYTDLKVHLQTADMAETSWVPADSTTVGQTWRHARRDGGPDRRYRDNPAIPVNRYALVILRANQYEVGILVSSVREADGFVSALRSFAGFAAAKPFATQDVHPAQPPKMPLSTPEPTVTAMPAPVPSVSLAERPESWRWVAKRETVTVAGFEIPGLIYFGRGLSALSGYDAEPALINPSLPVASSSTGFDPVSIPYWPSYGGIEPAARHAYLSWHADGRAAPDAPISFVFLYFYGIERRILYDLGTKSSGNDEWASVLAEVRRLLSIYGANSSFRGYASRFLDIAEAVRKSPDINCPPPETAAQAYELPVRLKMGLGQMAQEGRPIPPAWARLWATTDPAFPRRTSFLRCREYFDELFDVRYCERFAEGVVVKPNKTLLQIEYRPASASFSNSIVAKTQVPDVTALKEPAGKLRALAEACSEELAPFSRYLGRNPNGAKDLAALALLPPILLSQSRTEHIQQLRDRLAAAAGPGALLRREELLQLVEFPQSEGLSKRDAVALAQTLASAGFGIEPDVRFGGAAPTAGSRIFVFPLVGVVSNAPTPAYSAATLLIHLATIVAAADGSVSVEEQAHLENHVAAALHLSDSERLRLDAHLRWTLAERSGMSGIKKRIEALTSSQREDIGEFLVSVANADGYISPEEIESLGRMYRLLGLNPQDVYSHAHAAATEPVSVEPAEQTASGFALPRRRPEKAQGIVRLDEEAVEAKLRETAAVSALLASVFVEETPPAPASIAEESGCIAGLSEETSAFVRFLVTKAAWTREELEAAAEARALLLDGTIEAINDTALDSCDELAIEGDEPVEVNIALLTSLIERTVTV